MPPTRHAAMPTQVGIHAFSQQIKGDEDGLRAQ
jgi:hypothetical protein